MFPGKKLDYRGIGIVEVGIPLSTFETSKITLLLLVQHQIFRNFRELFLWIFKINLINSQATENIQDTLIQKPKRAACWHFHKHSTTKILLQDNKKGQYKDLSCCCITTFYLSFLLNLERILSTVKTFPKLCKASQ